MQRHCLCTHRHRASLWDGDTLDGSKRKRLMGYQLMYNLSLKLFSFFDGFCIRVWAMTALQSGSPGMELLPHRKVKAALWDRYFSSSERLLVVRVWRVRRTRPQHKNCLLIIGFSNSTRTKEIKIQVWFGLPWPSAGHSTRVLISALNTFCHWDW